MSRVIQGILTSAQISPADGTVTKHKKPKISVSTSTYMHPNPGCGCYEDGFKVQQEVNEKGACFLSALFPENISRALREKDVDCVYYIGNICLLKKKKTNQKFPKLLFPREIQSAKGFDGMNAAELKEQIKIWKKLDFSCMHCALVQIPSMYTHRELTVHEIQSEERTSTIYEEKH